MQQEATNKIFTIPNLLSIARLLLLPVFFILLVQYENNFAAFLVLMIAALTDFVDGHIARATNSVSKLGQKLDPAIDRIFIVVAVVSLFVVGRLPLWILVVLIARDACMMLVTIYQMRKYNRDFKVIFLGKLATALLMAGFCSLVIMWPILGGVNVLQSSLLPGWGQESAPLGIWLIYIGTIASLITAAYYIYRGVRPHLSDAYADRQKSVLASATDIDDKAKDAGQNCASVSHSEDDNSPPQKRGAPPARSVREL